MQMIQCFSTIKTRMRVLSGYLKRLKNQNVIKETLLFSPTTVNAQLSCKVIKKWQPPISISTSPFQSYTPFLAKFLVPPRWLFLEVLTPFNKGEREFELWFHKTNLNKKDKRVNQVPNVRDVVLIHKENTSKMIFKF